VSPAIWDHIVTEDIESLSKFTTQEAYLLLDTNEHTPPSTQRVRLVLELPTPEGWKVELT